MYNWTCYRLVWTGTCILVCRGDDQNAMLPSEHRQQFKSDLRWEQFRPEVRAMPERACHKHSHNIWSRLGVCWVQHITKDQDETLQSRWDNMIQSRQRITKDQDNTLQRIKTTRYKGSRQDTMLTKLCSTWCALNVRDEKLQLRIPCKREHYTHLVDVQHFFQENFADHWRCRLFELVEVIPCNSKRCFFQLWSHPIHVAAPLLRPAGVCGQNWMSGSPRHLSSGPTPSMSPPLTGICGQIYPSTCGHSSSGPTLSVSPPLTGICVQIYRLTSYGC